MRPASELPVFKYHPDPIATGSIEPSKETCPCCGQVTGWEYTLEPYAVEEVEHLCPWCIASGEAAKRWDAIFNDDCTLLDDDVPPDVIAEVTKRTPGFDSFQQEEWQACCVTITNFNASAVSKMKRHCPPFDGGINEVIDCGAINQRIVAQFGWGTSRVI